MDPVKEPFDGNESMLRSVELCGWEVDGTNSASRIKVIHILRFEKDCVIQEDKRNTGEIE